KVEGSCRNNEIDHEVTDEHAISFRFDCTSNARIFRHSGAERAREHAYLSTQIGAPAVNARDRASSSPAPARARAATWAASRAPTRAASRSPPRSERARAPGTPSRAT